MVIILMGVVGAGKTTVGRLLAEKLKCRFADADDFHPPWNVEKIRNGVALNDNDRAPWLLALRQAINGWSLTGENVVLACSALKQKYRDELRAAGVRFVYLKGSRELILNRLSSRHGHFASESILDSQFADLEEPRDAVTVTVDNAPAAIANEIIAKLNLGEQAYPVPNQ